MKKIIFLIIPIVVIIGILCLNIYGCSRETSLSQNNTPTFDENIILKNLTVTFSDPEGDFVLEDPAPPKIYPFPPVDIKQISLGTDSGYLYICIKYYATTPTTTQNVEGHLVNQMNPTIALDTDNNLDTGGEGGSEAIASFLIEFSDSVKPKSYMAYNYTGNGNYANQVEFNYTAGGPGKDYVIMQIPMNILGVTSNQTINIKCWSESMSVDKNGKEEYHHFAFDFLGNGDTYSVVLP